MLQASPVSAPQRLETLDVLRGFALFGILFMNIRIMAAPFGAYMYPLALFEYTGPSRAAYLFSTTAFDLKMMGLFSMLFGVSVLLYAGKAPGHDTSVRALWFRRMFWLLLIGLVHAYLIWFGDILVFYALCGLLVLWWVRRWSARTLFIAACGLLVIGALLAVGHYVGWETMSEDDRAQEMLMLMPPAPVVEAELDTMLNGGYTGVVAYRAPLVLLFQTFMFAVFFFWRCSGMMLLGMALYKWGFLVGRQPTSTYARVAVLCLPVGLGLSFQGAMANDAVLYALPQRILLDLWNYVGAVFTSVGYAAVLILAVKRDVLRALRARLAAVGQMALTNYLLHSITTAVIFLGWGLGLAGRFDYAAQLVVVAAICLAQLVLSPIWLARYRFGPAEWLWRSLTYGRRQPMRRDTQALTT
jgi:uncharacterized protein